MNMGALWKAEMGHLDAASSWAQGREGFLKTKQRDKGGAHV